VSKRQREFIDKLSNDVKELSEKKLALQDKQQKLGTGREQALTQLQAELKRKQQRARRQWEADEKLIFDKAYTLKAEAIRKAAADSFGPSLDKLVMEGKETVKAREGESAVILERLKRALYIEMEQKVQEAKAAMREEVRQDDEKGRRVGERRLDDALRRQAEETTLLKERFSREKKSVDEAAERGHRAGESLFFFEENGKRK
jgi:hypothetical protein